MRSAYAWTSTGRPTALAATEYLLLSKRTRQVFETDAGTAWNPSNRPAWVQARFEPSAAISVAAHEIEALPTPSAAQGSFLIRGGGWGSRLERSPYVLALPGP